MLNDSKSEDTEKDNTSKQFGDDSNSEEINAKEDEQTQDQIDKLEDKNKVANKEGNSDWTLTFASSSLLQIGHFFYPKVLIFFHEKHMLLYSLEVPHQGTSNGYSQHMFSWEIRKKILDTPPTPAHLLIWSYDPYTYGYRPMWVAVVK